MKENIYHTSMPPIQNRSYGRHIQQLVDAIKREKERSNRTAMAYAAIQLMADYSKAKEKNDAQQAQLWKDLYEVAQEDLQIDAPYPYTPASTTIEKRKLPYPKRQTKTNLQSSYLKPCIEELTRNPDPEDQITKMTTLVIVANRLGMPIESADQLLITLQPLLKNPVTIPRETIQQIIEQNKKQHARKTPNTSNRHNYYRKKERKNQKSFSRK